MRDEPDDGRVRGPGERREDGVLVVQLGVLEADLSQLVDEQPREIELLLRARALGNSILALRVHADVAQEPLEDVIGQLLRERAGERCSSR